MVGTMVRKDSACSPFRHVKDHHSIQQDDETLLPPKQASGKSHTSAVAVTLAPPSDCDSVASSEVSKLSGDDANEILVRENWTRQFDFFLSCVGYAVGLGNIWRFPYLCYRSGGGAFLIPYLLFLVICGMPLFFLELSFGQFASLGPIAIWKVSPLFRGLGYGMVIISGIVCIYYNVIIAWTMYYMYQSFSEVLPWSTCNNWWNTEQCTDMHDKDNITETTGTLTFSPGHNVTTMLMQNFTNGTAEMFLNATRIGAKPRTTASEEFWLYKVLHLSSGIENLGGLQWTLVLSLVLAWIVIFLCLMKGVKSSGKVVYISATFPYLVLIILLIRGVTLPGANEGIIFYLKPRWELLKSFKVWGDAATQIFYSVGAAWGAVLTMASYNRFDNNCYRDAIIIPLINCATSIFAGFVVFSIIGFMAYESGKSIEDVVSQGPGLAFVVYPAAVARLPISPLWAMLFFCMLFTIGLDSQFGMFEVTISAFVDEFPQYLRKRKVLFTAIMCVVLFLLGLPCVTEGGMYVLQLMDWYSATFSLMIISLLETVAIGWVYGADRFMQDISLMVGRIPPIWWKLCWCYITPSTILCLLVFIFINHTPVTYNNYTYPEWSIGVGWMMAMCSLLPIPIIAINEFCKAEGNCKERLIQCIRPSPEWGPASEENRLLYKKSISITPSRFKQLYVSGLQLTGNELCCKGTSPCQGSEGERNAADTESIV